MAAKKTKAPTQKRAAGSPGAIANGKKSPTTQSNPKQSAAARKPNAKERTAAKSVAPTKKTLPLALAKNAEKQHAAKLARLVKEGRDDIALIQRRQARITEDFYDIGEALVRLKRPGVAEALGFKGFRDLCQNTLPISATTAEKLVSIVANVRREDAHRLGQEKTLALLELSKATPEADTATSLSRTSRKLASGKQVNLSEASTREIRAAAKEVRDQATSKTRGRTTTADERSHALAVQKKLQQAGFEKVRITAVASKPGQAADVRMEGIPLAAVQAFGRALIKAG